MRECAECAFDMDAVPAVTCTTHKWHNDSLADMCCLCGLDAEMLVK